MPEDHRSDARCRKSAAFTLVELLVVITIIGILIALLLPAVQAAREAARRMQCSNNIKQVGLAMHSFESQKNMFPPGTFAKQRFSANDWTCYLHFLLPYLEQQAYYDALGGPTFNLPNPWNNPAPWAGLLALANKGALSMLLCPSDSLGGSWNELGLGAAAGVALPKSSYLGIFPGLRDGDNYSGGMYTNPVPMSFGGRMISPRAAFRPYEGTPIADITDGTSNTMAMAEYLKGIDENDHRGDYHSNRAGLQFLYVTLGPNSPTQDNLCSAFCPNGASPNDLSANLPCMGGGDDANFASPRSRHAGGVNAVFCDGSVRFIQDGIDTTTWRSLGWIADGNTPTDGN